MIVKKLSELNYRVRVLGGKKSVVVHHNRLKPRDDDPTVPVAAPDMSVPSSVISDVQPPSRSSPFPRFAALDGDSYLSPYRDRDAEDGASAAQTVPGGGVGELPPETASSLASPSLSVVPRTGVGPVTDDGAPPVVQPVPPVPSLRRSERISRPTDFYRPS